MNTHDKGGEIRHAGFEEGYRLGVRGSEAETEKLREALQRILRESSDGEAVAIAAEALGLALDRTDG